MAKKPSPSKKPTKRVQAKDVALVLSSVAELLPGILGIASLFTKRGAITIPRESRDYQFSTTHFSNEK